MKASFDNNLFLMNPFFKPNDLNYHGTNRNLHIGINYPLFFKFSNVKSIERDAILCRSYC